MSVIEILANDSALMALAESVLCELALRQEPVSALRISKRLGIRMSTLLRCLAFLGDGNIGGYSALGWVQLHQDGDRLLLTLSEQGRLVCSEIVNNRKIKS